MRAAVTILLFAALVFCWQQAENLHLSQSVGRLNSQSSQQQITISSLQNQLSHAGKQAEKNELALVELRQKLNAADLQEAQREKTIARLIDENEAFRRWHSVKLPDAVRQLQQRNACASAGNCLQRLSTGDAMPDAGQRSKN